MSGSKRHKSTGDTRYMGSLCFFCALQKVHTWHVADSSCVELKCDDITVAGPEKVWGYKIAAVNRCDSEW